MKDVTALEAILKAIVEAPDAVEVVRSVDERGVLLTAKVAQADAGKVIGREGATLHKIRGVMGVVGAANDSHISVVLDVPDRPARATASITPSTPEPDKGTDDPIGYEERT